MATIKIGSDGFTSKAQERRYEQAAIACETARARWVRLRVLRALSEPDVTDDDVRQARRAAIEAGFVFRPLDKAHRARLIAADAFRRAERLTRIADASN